MYQNFVNFRKDVNRREAGVSVSLSEKGPDARVGSMSHRENTRARKAESTVGGQDRESQWWKISADESLSFFS